MSRHGVGMTWNGSRLQAGIPKGNPRNSPLRANGLTLQGVVVAVYVYDSDIPIGSLPEGDITNAIYADVLCYGKHEGCVPHVLVTYARQGMHEGEISLPKVASKDIGGEFNRAIGLPPSWDGDHVVIGFLEDDLKKPYIQKYLPHPSSDVGNNQRNIGHRMRLKEEDGSPRFWKHKGGFWGIDKLGNFLMDLTRAHAGEYDATCNEPTPALNGANGNYSLKIPQTSKLTIEITKGVKQGTSDDNDSQSTKLILENNKLTVMNEGGAGVVVQDSGSGAVLTLGNGAVHAAIAEHLESLYNQLTTWLTATTVLTALGPSAPLPTLAGPPPPWTPTINSSKLEFPDG